MVLLAASICTKDGTALLSRQFVEMSKARIEGLIATFPKLIGSGKQHTFVETESVRYVYQPLEKLYVLLITTKASNILEDLETLRLFARVIPEYACGMDESDILLNAFQLIFAFDEIIALGYREDVNLTQIRTFTEMDSHEERVFRAVQENKERDAKELMKVRARELQQARMEANKRSGGSSGISSGFSNYKSGFGSGGFGSESNEPRIVVMRDRLGEPGTDNNLSSTPAVSGVIPSVKRSGMQLGGQSSLKSVDHFVDRLKAEGELVNEESIRLLAGPGDSNAHSKTGRQATTTASRGQIKKEDLHIRIEEKLTVLTGRDGGLENMELQGIMHAQANTNNASGARLHVDTTKATNPTNKNYPSVQMQTHPNIDKKVFLTTNWIQIKPGGKSFPLGQEVGVLRWRFQTQDESAIPITVNCWPNEITGGFEVNAEYELQDTNLTLHDVLLSIPLPPGSKTPSIGNCDGECEPNARKTHLEWRLPLVDKENASGSIEFTIKTERGTKADQFFPLQVHFGSDKSLCGISVLEATLGTQNTPVPFSSETNFFTERYEIS